jgi:hypothetical protein
MNSFIYLQLMTSADPLQFKLPPITECISRDLCLGFGKKVHSLNKICTECLLRHEPQQLRILANDNVDALAIIDKEIARKQVLKQNTEAHNRFLCAFEDPDYIHYRWRRRDLNLRGTRLSCSVVRRKGMACEKCWRHHLQRIGIVQYFTPTGMCHEEADKIVLQTTSSESIENDDDEDVEGYNIIAS